MMPDPVALLAAARTPFAPPARPRPAQARHGLAALAATAVNAAIGRARLGAGRSPGLMLACDETDPALAEEVAQQAGLRAASACTSGVSALASAWQALQGGRQDCLVLAGLASDSPRMAPAEPGHFAAHNARTRHAIDDGHFTWEIVPLQSNGALVNRDTLPSRPGPVEGAAALVLGRQPGNNTLAQIVALVEQAARADTIGDAAADACQAALAAAGWAADEVDLWMLDERQAGLAERVRERFALSDSRINPDGGNLAFGDAGPADALRQLIGLLGALRRQGRRRGLLCVSDQRQVLALALEFEARIACGGRASGPNPAGA